VIKLRKLKWARYVIRKKEMRNTYKITLRISQGEIPNETPTRGNEDNIKVDLK
jgi:hypothetical protein